MKNEIDFKEQQARLDELLRVQEYAEALTLVRWLLESALPADFAAHLLWVRAKAYTGLGDWDKAAEAWTCVLETHPEDVETVFAGRGFVREQAGDSDGAHADYLAAGKFKHWPGPSWAARLLTRVRALWNHGVQEPARPDPARWNAVETACTRAIASAPENPHAHYQRAFVHYCRKNWDALIADCSRAVELKPDFAEAYSLRGAGYDKKAQEEPPQVDWTRVVDSRPEDVHAYGLRGSVHTELGTADRLLAERLRAARAAPDKKAPPVSST